MCSIRSRQWIVALCGLLALAACGGTESVPDLVPTVEAVDPAVGYSNSETPISIRGVMPFTPIASLSGDSRVEAPYQVRLGDVPLERVAWIDPDTLSAVVPTNVAPGVYPLTVRSPSGAEATLEGAFEVLPGASQTGALVVESATISPNTISVGQQVTVTAVVQNSGDAAVREVAAAVESTFTGLGAALASPAPQDIDAGQSATFSWTYQPTTTTPVGGITLSVRAAGVDPTSGSPVAAAPLATNSLVVNPPAAITAASSAPASVRSGQTITLTLTVTNGGSAPADVTPILDPPTTSGLATVSPATGATLEEVRLPGNAPARSFSWEFTSGGGPGTITFSARVSWRDANSGQTGTASTAPIQVQVVPAPTLAAIAPTSGPTIGGTPVAITGANFLPGASVTFDGAPATGVNVESPTRITARTPAHAAGAVNVVVTNLDGQAASGANAFTYVAPPTLASISPTSGSTAGNVTVTLTGSEFANGAAVLLDGVPLQTLVVNGTTLRATMPAHAAGQVNLIVRNPDGQTSAARVFTYVVPAPTITEIAPTSGPTAGGTSVAITGTDFVTGATVTFGGAAATGVNVESPTRITAMTPVHDPGPVNVVVRNPDGQTSAARVFTYVGPAVVTASSSGPASVRSGQTVRVTLTVTNSGASPADVTPVIDPPITSGATVSPATGSTLPTVRLAGSEPARSFTWDFTSGGGPGTLTFNARVSWRDVISGQSGTTPTAPIVVQVVPAPTISGVAPAAGPTTGGTQVQITGTNFVPGATVSFGGTASNAVTVNGPTLITTTTPAHAAGTVSVVVTNPDGQTATGGNAFTYATPPTLTGINPATGSTAGGFQVTLAGTNLAGGTILLDGVPLPTTPVSGTALRATMPAHAAGTVNLTVGTAGGQSSPATFTYIEVPVVTAVAPRQGATAGGYPVTITGSGFASGAAVTFGTMPAVVTSITPTAITVTAPAHVAGQITVTVTSNGQSASGAFTYAGPTISSVNPPSGPTAGGTPVEITGTNFVAGATVTIGGTNAAPVTVTLVDPVENITRITVPTPPNAAGPVSVIVTNPDRAAVTAVNAFTYVQ